MSKFLLNKWANLGVILLFFDKIRPKFQMPWKSGQNWPKFDNKKPFLLSKISFENFPCQIISSR